MREWIKRLWRYTRLPVVIEEITSNYWLIPGSMAVVGLMLGFALVQIDQSIEINLSEWSSIIYNTQPDGAREVLSTIASSMITVAGVVFSITMVVLSLTSQQYGALTLKNFMRDRGNQIVLGTFTATFIYCLVVLRTIRATEDSSFVPRLSLVIGVVLALVSLAVLIYFIHHVSHSIHASTIVTRITRHIVSTVDSLYSDTVGYSPTDLEIDDPESCVPDDLQDNVALFRAGKSGYVQTINEDRLIELAQEHDAILVTELRPGSFVVRGTVLCSFYPSENASKALQDDIREAFVIGAERTQAQDLDYLMIQLVQMAVRAMSPGINDPFTTMMCIDHLGEVLCELARRQMPSPYRFDQHLNLRVITNPITYEDALKLGFGEIFHYSKHDPAVTLHIMHAFNQINECIAHEAHRDVLQDYASQLFNRIDSRDMLEDQYQAIKRDFRDLFSNSFSPDSEREHA